MSRRKPLWSRLGFYGGLMLVALTLRPVPKDTRGVNEWGALPVLHGGRVKPMDSVARSTLLMLSGKQSLRVDGREHTAMEWLLDILFKPRDARTRPVFNIDDPDVLGLMSIQQSNKRRYSFNDLEPHLSTLAEQARQADQAAVKSRYQTAVSNLNRHVVLYQKLSNTLGLSARENRLEHVKALEQAIPIFMHHRSAGRKNTAKEVAVLSDFVREYGFVADAAEFYPLPPVEGPATPVAPCEKV